MVQNTKTLTYSDIQKYIKNRYPFLLIDFITDYEPGSYAKGYKNLTNNEWFFPCHYDYYPNMPGVLQIESLLEVFILTFITLPQYQGMRTSDSSLNHIKLRREIFPGDCLEIEAKLISLKRGVARGTAVGYVNSDEACCAEMTVVMPDILKQFTPPKL